MGPFSALPLPSPVCFWASELHHALHLQVDTAALWARGARLDLSGRGVGSDVSVCWGVPVAGEGRSCPYLAV